MVGAEPDGRDLPRELVSRTGARVQTNWLRIPSGSLLEVAFGMANPTKAAALPGATFEIRAEGRDGSSSALLRQTVGAEHVAGRREWLQKRIALGYVE